MSTYNVIDLSGICWKSATGEVRVSEMDTDRLIRTYAWIVSRQARLEDVRNEIHPLYQESLMEQNGRTLQEWREIFLAAINARATKEVTARIARLEAELRKYEPADEAARLRAELDNLRSM